MLALLRKEVEVSRGQNEQCCCTCDWFIALRLPSPVRFSRRTYFAPSLVLVNTSTHLPKAVALLTPHTLLHTHPLKRILDVSQQCPLC